MTTFLSVADLVQLLHRVGLRPFIEALAQALHTDFCRWPDFEKAPRVASHSPQGVIELMPISDGVDYAFKYVNGHPRNGERGLPTVMAFGVLAEVATGYPRWLVELTVCTALRTATTSALAARALARPDARRMALLGCGAQSAFQALAFETLLGIEHLAVFDPDPAACARLQAHLSRVSGLRVTVAASAHEAVRGADIVTTATAAKRHARVLTVDMVAPGMHLNAIGGDCPGKTELDPEVLRRARIVVELEAQTRIEGDIQQLPPDWPVTELWRVLRGEVPGRESAEQVTLFDSVGFALEDYSVLRTVARLAEQHGLGQPLDLVPDLRDPKDVFGLLGDA
ncbi:ornithine cyclodeaminase [Comamonas serinivorans]|uniref:Ornithine cyclodeaminase n=1 Tax=Comamonas serinivorans TaxID=1082851 RepID=A0A1Y0EIZ5_9BURK|nr:ornithine cyclodeaminase [Comamonas serinivorans]ARU03567.1 ornithine cyclodeaminase [Comamonas serinivorans]